MAWYFLPMGIDGRKVRDWLGIKEAAAYLGVSVKYLYKRKDLCPPSYVIGGKLRYTKTMLDEWLEKHRYSAN